MKSEDTPDTTSSRGSRDGNSPSSTPDGRTTDQSGPDRVPVSRFRAREKDRQKPIPVTCGPIFSDLSPSTDLQLSLVSRLQALLDENGIPPSDLILKILTIKAGHPLSLLQLSAHRTNGKGYGGWQTPRARGDAGGLNRWKKTGRHKNLEDQMKSSVANWRTPTATEWAGGAYKDLEKLKARHSRGRQVLLVKPVVPQRHSITGYWDEYDLVRSRIDGKDRPRKPGLPLLVDGVPDRVGRIRGYGNSIVPQVAALFVMASMEAIDDQ